MVALSPRARALQCRLAPALRCRPRARCAVRAPARCYYKTGLGWRRGYASGRVLDEQELLVYIAFRTQQYVS